MLPSKPAEVMEHFINNLSNVLPKELLQLVVETVVCVIVSFPSVALHRSTGERYKCRVPHMISNKSTIVLVAQIITGFWLVSLDAL